MTCAADPQMVLPFAKIDDIMAELLIGTGVRGRAAMIRLMRLPDRGIQHYLGQTLLSTPAGKLRIQALNQNGNRALHISLSINAHTGYVNGEWYSLQGKLADTLCIAAQGLPLSALCEVPEAFPGRDRIIERVRTFTRSTRIKIQSDLVTVKLSDFPAPRRSKYP